MALFSRVVDPQEPATLKPCGSSLLSACTLCFNCNALVLLHARAVEGSDQISDGHHLLLVGG